ncbi:hypothetical protein AVEN_130369-1 [Araneus ventricosus]|uniref:Uncharacterized protein n=1 Tax=Araneus ventricosus TaxID=182803 RepID=A0A4Y2BGI7_ARAVE|nr:hypothetical protein AVEN_130369-1 [Araneus ventricosus]
MFVLSLKLRSNCLSFHELHLWFALFLVVGTGRIDVARGLGSASVVSRIIAVNSSRMIGRVSGQTASVHLFTRALPRDFHRRNGAKFGIPPTTINEYEPRGLLSHTQSEQGFWSIVPEM